MYFFFRMANARAKAEQADLAAEKAQQDSDLARLKAKQYAPEFHQPGMLFSQLISISALMRSSDFGSEGLELDSRCLCCEFYP